MKKLSEIELGKKVKIIKILGEGRYWFRLMEMGLIPGTVVKIVKVTPLRDPLVILVRGYELSLRHPELEQIIVEETR